MGHGRPECKPGSAGVASRPGTRAPPAVAPGPGAPIFFWRRHLEAALVPCRLRLLRPVERPARPAPAPHGPMVAWQRVTFWTTGLPRPIQEGRPALAVVRIKPFRPTPAPPGGTHPRPLGLDSSPLHGELLGVERLEERARALAAGFTVSRRPRRDPRIGCCAA